MSNEKTMENLMAAFAGESQANRKYMAYAKRRKKKAISMRPNSLQRRQMQRLFTHLKNLSWLEISRQQKRTLKML